MEIAVRVRDTGCTDALLQEVERRINFAVDRHRTQIDRISVDLRDVNGPRGGVDKLCLIAAGVRGAAPVMILEQGRDLAAVVTRAAQRLGYRIGRRLHRRRISGAPEHRTTIRAA